MSTSVESKTWSNSNRPPGRVTVQLLHYCTQPLFGDHRLCSVCERITKQSDYRLRVLPVCSVYLLNRLRCFHKWLSNISRMGLDLLFLNQSVVSLFFYRRQELFVFIWPKVLTGTSSVLLASLFLVSWPGQLPSEIFQRYLFCWCWKSR